MIKAVFRTAKEAWTDRNQRRIFITFELQTLEDRGLLALGQTYFLHDNESLKMFSTEDIARELSSRVLEDQATIPHEIDFSEWPHESRG